VEKKSKEAQTIFVGGVYERKRTGSVTTHVARVLADGLPVAELLTTEAGGARATSTQYVHTDRLGSTRAVTDAAGTVISRFAYAAFGARRVPAMPGVPASPSPGRGFTDHAHDDELGLIDMKGRVYDPELGRFLTPDPIVGRPGAQALNRYSYVGNHPLSATDPTGFDETLLRDGAESPHHDSNRVDEATGERLSDDWVAIEIRPRDGANVAESSSNRDGADHATKPPALRNPVTRDGNSGGTGGGATSAGGTGDRPPLQPPMTAEEMGDVFRRVDRAVQPLDYWNHGVAYLVGAGVGGWALVEFGVLGVAAAEATGAGSATAGTGTVAASGTGAIEGVLQNTLGARLYLWLVGTGLPAGHVLLEGLCDGCSISPHWELPPFGRGLAIEAQLGGNLPRSFPVFDRVSAVADDVVELVSIKSMDLRGYRGASGIGRMTATLERYIVAISNFTTRTFDGVTVSAGPGTQRVLELVVPLGSVTPEQAAVIQNAAGLAAQWGIELRVVGL
jgi:RHS repeat-associated protein